MTPRDVRNGMPGGRTGRPAFLQGKIPGATSSKGPNAQARPFSGGSLPPRKLLEQFRPSAPVETLTSALAGHCAPQSCSRERPIRFTRGVIPVQPGSFPERLNRHRQSLLVQRQVGYRAAEAARFPSLALTGVVDSSLRVAREVLVLPVL